ncbi:hypothetical protein [Nostoc sp. 'Lobaria pulmonaria (5183) cyanobiont']|uniref:hypothetical protein n=1 Tax=Nostoc sp. 'Lobaria pulmonaria (5183) cyanobiont' TaxID=1618022 RepID=UPI001319FB39|nr:hypothetical protein [Nostoc sp. 'Lobaria pulmonaria (5183) cyanobiont']
MRLTVWLGSHIRVPHLTFEFGTLPDIFSYLDYIPRTDLLTDLDGLGVVCSASRLSPIQT